MLRPRGRGEQRQARQRPAHDREQGHARPCAECESGPGEHRDHPQRRVRHEREIDQEQAALARQSPADLLLRGQRLVGVHDDEARREQRRRAEEDGERRHGPARRRGKPGCFHRRHQIPDRSRRAGRVADQRDDRRIQRRLRVLRRKPVARTRRRDRARARRVARRRAERRPDRVLGRPPRGPPADRDQAHQRQQRESQGTEAEGPVRTVQQHVMRREPELAAHAQRDRGVRTGGRRRGPQQHRERRGDEPAAARHQHRRADPVEVRAAVLGELAANAGGQRARRLRKRRQLGELIGDQSRDGQPEPVRSELLRLEPGLGGRLLGIGHSPMLTRGRGRPMEGSPPDHPKENAIPRPLSGRGIKCAPT